jgi:HKD family nuclease
MKRLALTLVAGMAVSCGGATSDPDGPTGPAGGKADGFADDRVWEVLLNDPHCDVCSSADKAHLLDSSATVQRLIELIDGADTSVEIAQFTWSNRDIEAAVLRAAAKPGVEVRIAINHAQEEGDTVARRLADAGVDVTFVRGRDNGNFFGLQHAKFLRVDGETIAMGSNNYSSTGLSFNEENTVVLTSDPDDPILLAFGCYFDEMFSGGFDDAASCSTDEVKFTPSSAPSKVLRDEFRAATTSIDVLMHHLLFDKTIKELTKAAQRGVRVRVVANAADRDQYEGGLWTLYREAGGEIRFKQTNTDAFQLMHHKLAVVDGKILLNGSGNWSGSAFFNNFEFYLRTEAPEAVQPFDELFQRLWQWSLSDASLDAGLSAAQQDSDDLQIFFGNLHAHFAETDGGHLLDDGKNEREGDDGQLAPVDDGGDPARFAYEYARDEGGLDFMALSPHVVDDRPDDPPDLPNMSKAGYAGLLETSARVTEESDGIFVALPSMEWSTNSTGNHVGILGTTELCKAQRGAFDELFEDFLPGRAAAGESPLVMFNHPRTFRHHEDSLEGSWDQVFGVNLQEIPRAGDRSKKFNDFGLDDFEPLRSVRASWIDGSAEPDPAVVAETLANINEASSPYVRMMEVTVGRGTEFASEEPQNPSLSEDEDGNIERFVKAHSDWDFYLRNGFRMAPVANHDNHRANWGTGHTSRTAILAPRLDEASLLAAIDDRAAYASEDENLEIRMYAEGRVRSGQELRTLDDEVSLQVHLSDPDFAGRFDVAVFVGVVGGDAVKNVQSVEMLADEWQEVTVALPGEGEHFVYLEILEPEPNRMAWTAPVWVHKL